MAEYDAIYICGSDQHGTPIELAAIKAGIPPEQFADKKHIEIKKAFEDFGFTFTYYGKTHTEQNKETVYEIFNALKKNNYIIEIEDENPYCEIDKRFLSDRFIEGICPYCESGPARGDQCDNCNRLLTPKQIIKPFCKICGKSEIRFVKTKNLAIDYPKLQPKILKFVKNASKNNWSKNAINKTLSSIDEGLKPVEITRNLKWGFPVPVKGFEDTVYYVWFDAPIGYIGITKEWDSERWKDYWLDSETKLVQFLGKDNIQFHTIHWPGMLIGSDLGYTLPYSIRASEFLTVSDGLKFSKSQGRGLDVVQVLDVLPADYWRFALVYLYPETSDSSFTIDIFVEIVNKIMNDKIGNFFHRVLTLAKNNEKLIDFKNIKIENESNEKIKAIIKKYREHLEKGEIREALRAVVEIADIGNSLMSAEKPWELTKRVEKESGASKKFSDVLCTLINVAYVLSILLYPFTPFTSKNALAYFGIVETPRLNDLDKNIKVDLRKDIKPLFSKVEKDELKKLLSS